MGESTLLFLRQLARNPRQISALAPSSRILARAMAKGIGPASGPIVEFGPGTGRLTEAILATGLPPERLTCFELDPAFVRHIRQRFPGVTVVHAGADRAGEFAPTNAEKVISGLPLLSMPPALRLAIVRAAFDILAPGGEMVQFTYGANPPLSEAMLKELGLSVTRGAFVALNLPPARIYRFRRQ